MVLSDKTIIRLAEEEDMIEPFTRRRVEKVGGEPVVSYGLSSYGYDIRIGDEFKVFSSVEYPTVDPKDFDEASFDEIQSETCVIPPNSFVLGESVERFKIPRDVLGICIGKSTYARCGIILNTTAFEPEWEGKLTLEVSNTTPLPAKIYGGEGIAQAIFMKGDRICEVSYKDKGGKYQGQEGATGPKV